MSAPFAQVQVFAPRVFEVSGLTAAQIQVGAGYAQPIARLKPGVTLEQATTELAAISRRYKERFAARLDAENTSVPQPYVASLVGGLEPTFYTLLGAVGFVLLIACANVSSLFLGRLAAREKEIAVRQSLGASRGRVVRQFLAESLVFSIDRRRRSAWCSRSARSAALQTLLSTQLPPNTAVTLNWRARVVHRRRHAGQRGAGRARAGLQASRPQLVEALKDGARGSSGARAGRFRAALIVAEVALSVVLLVGSGPPARQLPGAAAHRAGIRSGRRRRRLRQRSRRSVSNAGAAGRLLRARRSPGCAPIRT